jgi:hypothetical protein
MKGEQPMDEAMMKLSREGFEQARSFIQSKARTIEQRLFEFHFEDSSLDTVLKTLAQYQNDDGGFGHGIEPDFRARVSSPAGTAYGFQILREVRAPATHDMIRKGVEFFLRTYDESLACWPRRVPGFNDDPHEAHWRYDPDIVVKEAELEWAWPSAEIVGYLYDYAELVPPGFLARVTQQAVTHILSLSDQSLDQMMLFAVQALCVRLSEPHRQVVLEKATKAAPKALPDPKTWKRSWDVPLMFVQSPHDPLASALQEQVACNLDLEIETQREDGAFAPEWTKGGPYEDEWNGYLTLRTLKALKAFGRLDTT